jgi:hypothetical protein
MISVAQLFLGLSILSFSWARPSPPKVEARTDINSGDVIIQMFEWNWDSLAAECTAFIGPAGYRYIQVSPPQETITGSQWWTSYQAVSYTLSGKRGTRDEFANMIATCKSAGVDVIVDVLTNDMAGIDSGVGVDGTSFTHYDYPPLYSTDDFHYCGTDGNDIQDWTNGWQVQNCELSNLADLKTESDSVRAKIAAYLSDVLSLGAAGFRLDAAKHVPIADLQAILALAPGAEFITQEVDYASGDIQPADYQVIGDVTEFYFEDFVRDAFLGNNGNSISGLSSIGDSSFIPGGKANVFIATHDTERSGEALTVNSPSNTYTNAHVFMLAYNYGNPMVLSSYSYSSSDDGAPNGGYGTCAGNAGVNGFYCQHRWNPISEMVKFRKSAGTGAITNWVSPESDRIAFGRGSTAFVAINNADQDWTSSFTTSLANGVYCNVISSNNCQQQITVSNGQFQVTVPARNSIAMHTGSMSTGSGTTTPSSGVAIHPNGDSSKCMDVAGGNIADGTSVQIYDCNETNAQRWTISEGATKVQVAGTNFCLDSGSTPGDGVQMKIWQCYDGLAAQQWYFTDDNRIALEGQGQCLDLTNGSEADGNVLQTWECGTGDNNQVWTV